jgi:hypothetical protein
VSVVFDVCSAAALRGPLATLFVATATQAQMTIARMSTRIGSRLDYIDHPD